MSDSPSWFSPDEEGFVRHWLLVGPEVTEYDGDAATEQKVRAEVIDRAILDPPTDAAPGRAGPLRRTWRFYPPGRNVFLEQSGFYHKLSRLEMIGATDLVVPSEVRLAMRVWTANTADVWLNGRHLLRYTGTLHRRPDGTSGFLNLRAGANRLVVRVQELAARECPFLVGVQLVEGDAVRVMLPGDEEATRRLAEVDGWLGGLRAAGRRSVRADSPPPVAVTVGLSGRIGNRQAGAAAEEIGWPAGDSACAWDREHVASVTVSAEPAGQRLTRVLEFPASHRAVVPPRRDPAEHRQAYLREVASSSGGRHQGDVMGVLARHVLGEGDESADAAAVAGALDWIDGRPDCADFPLSALLRLRRLDWGGEAVRRRIARTLLGFRYWPDEAGSDAMCFGSENHALLFHGCQYLAGLLLPDERFAASGRTGREQAAVGRRRCEAWLAERERYGFWEFLSSTYFPLTAGALMNLVDFADSPELARRAAGLVDRIFEMLADHGLDGVTVGPQGRVYRGILYPHTSGSQGMLCYAEPGAAWATSPWMTFLASSPSYRPPAGLADRLAAPARKRYRQANVRIHLHKTPHAMLSSLEIPCDFGDGIGGAPLLPGELGYQQHLWHATVGRDCHVFVNHPGASFDFSQARPGFWYGNGHLPRLRQDGRELTAEYDLPGTHPIQFTHAHWPTDVFDRCERRRGWHFGAKGEGYVGLWCSRPTRRESEVLTDRELRASGGRVTWRCRCGDRQTDGDFERFVAGCLSAPPGRENV